MNRIKTAALLPLVCLLISGCATNRPARFHEAKNANAVLQFSSWDYTFLLRPRYDDNGFLLQVPRDHVSEVFNSVNLQQRDLAVVVVGWNRNAEELKQLVTDWNAILRGCGFQRVVLVKSTGHKEINGSIIIDDSASANSTVQTAPQPVDRAANTIVAPAAGANASDSSSHPDGKIPERVATRS